MIHIGKQIKEKLKESGKTVVWFSNALSCSRTNVYKLFGKASISTEDLYRISCILHYNFFEDLAAETDDAIENLKD